MKTLSQCYLTKYFRWYENNYKTKTSPNSLTLNGNFIINETSITKTCSTSFVNITINLAFNIPKSLSQFLLEKCSDILLFLML